ncbi:DUF1003 domain-containing protein [Streptomyces sp. PR69]|uniref:DUF1003 domain-containing protein n=1 Tax=Streptomyces sp. PR69 TaxID=2984950 RepID=UPI0022653895|nr:DUF1003 domain-containing protein [Streptomyces sp. PR69]
MTSGEGGGPDRMERLEARERMPSGASAVSRHRTRLDMPRAPRRTLLPEYDPEVFGRLSERIARFLGTWRFIAWMTGIVVIWIGWNAAAPKELRFDEYPFIFLTLALSLQASYAAPLILLAQNRQADRDRVTHEQDRKQNERSIADTEYLTREIAALRMGLGEVATRDWIRSELEEMTRTLEGTLEGTLEEQRAVFPSGDGNRSDEHDR